MLARVFISFPLLIILVLSFSQLSLSSPTSDSHNTCIELSEQISKQLSLNEDSIITYIKSHMHHLKGKAQPCIDLLVKTGKLNSLETYLSELSQRGIKYRESWEMSINTMKRAFDDIHDKHRFDEIEYQTVAPAFQWAQSMDMIFIEIKFAHRHDTPGCLEMKDTSVSIKDNYVAFVGYCVLGDVPIKIDFSLRTWQKINPEMSTHEFGSVGKYQFKLLKEQTGMYWDRLWGDGIAQPSNMRVWFEMKDKFESELEKYEKEDEEALFKREVEQIEKEANDRKAKSKVDKKDKKKKKKKVKKGNAEVNGEDTKSAEW